MYTYMKRGNIIMEKIEVSKTLGSVMTCYNEICIAFAGYLISVKSIGLSRFLREHKGWPISHQFSNVNLLPSKNQ